MKGDWKKWVPAVVIVATFAGLFGVCPYATGYGEDRKSIAYWLWYFWRFPEWQHAILAPLIVAGLVWWKRRELSALSIRGSGWGIPLILFGLLLFFAGYRSNIYYFGYAAFQILSGGAIIWLLGWPFFRRLAFAWCFLAFMWPLYFLESRLGFPLRMLMTELCSGILNASGVDHLQLGTALVSPADPAAGLAQGEHFALEVANPCSGIRSLFALMMVGALYGYLTLKHPWQWIAMWAAALPLAIAGNVVRILLLLGGTRLFGSEFAIGRDGGTSFFHFFAGIAVFGTAIGGMVLISRLIRLRRKTPAPPAESGELPASA